jgi:hypothetical protein
MVLPDRVAKGIQPEWFVEGENIRVADAFVVDLMLNANGQTFDTLRQYATTIDLDEIPVQAVNLEGLLLTRKPRGKCTCRIASSSSGHSKCSAVDPERIATKNSCARSTRVLGWL